MKLENEADRFVSQARERLVILNENFLPFEQHSGRALQQRRDFRPAWTNRKSIDDLLTAIRHIEEEGLDSRDYHLRAIERLKGQTEASSNPVLRAELDVLLTDGLTRLGYHLLFGKVDPKTFDRRAR